MGRLRECRSTSSPPRSGFHVKREVRRTHLLPRDSTSYPLYRVGTGTGTMDHRVSDVGGVCL